MNAVDWQSQALCRGAALKPFFGGSKRLHIARRMCSACPVQEVCLWQCMANEATEEYRYGVWGGSSRDERERLDLALGRPGAAEYRRCRDAELRRMTIEAEG